MHFSFELGSPSGAFALPISQDLVQQHCPNFACGLEKAQVVKMKQIEHTNDERKISREY